MNCKRMRVRSHTSLKLSVCRDIYLKVNTLSDAERRKKKRRSESDGNRNQNKQPRRPQNIIPIKGQEEEIGSSEC